MLKIFNVFWCHFKPIGPTSQKRDYISRDPPRHLDFRFMNVCCDCDSIFFNLPHDFDCSKLRILHQKLFVKFTFWRVWNELCINYNYPLCAENVSLHYVLAGFLEFLGVGPTGFDLLTVTPQIVIGINKKNTFSSLFISLKLI